MMAEEFQRAKYLLLLGAVDTVFSIASKERTAITLPLGTGIW